MNSTPKSIYHLHFDLLPISLSSSKRKEMALALHTQLVCLVLATAMAICAAGDDYAEPALNSGEEEAVYKVLEAVNSEIQWRTLYPNNLCTGGPHGVVCDWEANDGRWHIVELNLGWVADSANNPPCGKNASFSPYLALIPYVRKLFFYRCFVQFRAQIPHYLWNALQSVEHLVFVDNPALEGHLSPQVGMLTGLKRLIISGTKMAGPIPAEIGNLDGLRELVLQRSGFTERIPATVAALKNLVVLDLSRNALVGQLVPEFGQLASMAKMDVSFNALEGAIPASLAHARAVELLDLSHNNFSGGVPSFLARMPRLLDLHLSRNLLGGVIPDGWEASGKLRSLGLSSAQLVGRIPTSMGAMKELNYLALDNNGLEGFVPAQFGRMPQIYHMNLSNNRLIGSLPFSADFVRKMGRRLQLEGNSGLCTYDFEIERMFYLNVKSCYGLSLPEAMAVDNSRIRPGEESVSVGKMEFIRLDLLFLAAVICSYLL